MEILDNYIKELESELKIDVFNVKDVQLRLPSTKHKWVARLIKHKREIHVLEKQKADQKRLIIAEFTKTTAVRVAEMATSKLADNSEVLKEYDRKIRDQELLVEFLEKTEKILSSITFDIKNIIQLQTLEQT